MLPIALLPIAGLFLGIGATIETLAKNADAEAWETFGTFLKMMGDVPFANLPVLFAISVAIAFTNDAGVAGLTALIGFLIFIVVIAVFMNQGVINYNYVLAYVDDAGKDQKIVVSLKELYTGKDLIPKLTAEFSKLLGGTLGGKPIDDTFYQVISSSETPINYNLWFWKGDLAVDNKLTTSILGIGPTLNSGVFGGIIVGALVAFLYNRFYLTELPSYISFFSGVKFVPIVVFFAVIPLAFIFILIWPPVGAAFNWFGRSSGTLPVGLDSLFFGLIERSLIPFGLHHVFYKHHCDDLVLVERLVTLLVLGM
ncbi:PTS transporter subunit EIIC [Spiroplasma endosymbiont of Dromius quadrimaculatus]|uniref:PTS transporter subunit EIIC n=1 Tax=Spiroplasma endosymbiont of Dromius quadrimaculatus TaxID=3066283 RepID=UPI00313E904C